MRLVSERCLARTSALMGVNPKHCPAGYKHASGDLVFRVDNCYVIIRDDCMLVDSPTAISIRHLASKCAIYIKVGNYCVNYVSNDNGVLVENSMVDDTRAKLYVDMLGETYDITTDISQTFRKCSGFVLTRIPRSLRYHNCTYVYEFNGFYVAHLSNEEVIYATEDEIIDLNIRRQKRPRNHRIYGGYSRTNQY
jgi:hypothetical protein